MDQLRRDDLDRARATPPGEKLQQALELMSQGVAMKRVSLRAKHPDASEEEVEAFLRDWLLADE